MSRKYEFVTLARREGANIRETLSSLHDLTAHRLPVARPLLTGRGNRPCRTVAPPAPLTEPDPGGTRTSRPPGPRRAPRLGRPHDTQGLGGQRLRRRAQPQRHHCHPPPERPACQPRTNPAQLAPVRASPAERPLADGLQGPLPHRSRPMSPLDRPRRPLPLLHPPAGLRQRAHGDGAGMPHRRIPPLRPARPHAHGQRLPLGQRRQPPAHPADGLGSCVSASR